MSNFTEELLSKKLKKSEETIRDFSDPKLAGFLSTVEVSNYKRSVLDCNIECWYHIIKDFTFPTNFCQLTLDDAKLFIEIYYLIKHFINRIYILFNSLTYSISNFIKL